jgi:acetylglutamate kinase
MYRDQVFVVKVGGETIERAEDRASLLEQISVLQGLGVKVVLVHGGGPQATALAEKIGAESQFVDGRRVTDAAMLEAMVMSLKGTVRTMLLSSARAAGMKAIGLSGVDADLVTATRRPAQPVDYGFVGDIETVQPQIVNDLLEGCYLPVVSPLCADVHGQVLNVNADSFASALAVDLGATKLIIVSAVRGVLRDVADPNSLISVLDLPGLAEMEASGAMKEGMLPKASAMRKALEGGVKRVHVVSHRYPDSILTEIFTNEGCGTMIVTEMSEAHA